MKLETDVLILYFESELLTSIDHVSLKSSNTGFAWVALAFRYVTTIHEASILIYLTKDTAKNPSILCVWQAALSHPMLRYLLWHFLIKIFPMKTPWCLREWHSGFWFFFFCKANKALCLYPNYPNPCQKWKYTFQSIILPHVKRICLYVKNLVVCTANAGQLRFSSTICLKPSPMKNKIWEK